MVEKLYAQRGDLVAMRAVVFSAIAARGRTLMTRTQRHWLQKAADLNRGEFLAWGPRSQGGGAISRMLENLKASGWMKGPPWRITRAGRATLK